LTLTTAFWGAETHILDGVPHAMMLDATWRRPVEINADWLGRTFDRS
jgi:hypothetical protein